MVYSFRVGPYARSIYLDGTLTFQQIATEYWQPVKTYAATNFTQNQIDNALAQSYITQQEYDDTMAIKNAL